MRWLRAISRRARALFLIRWITLTLIGWLAYSLFRALWAVIALDAPVYDWQWYVPVILLLVGLPLYWSWCGPVWRASRGTKFMVVGLVACAIIGWNGLGQTVQLGLDRTASIPISFWAFSSFQQMPDSVLRDLKAAGSYIYLTPGGAAPFEGESKNALAGGIRRLAEHNLEVYLMVPAADFLSVPVYEEWVANAERAATFVQSEKLTNVRGLIGDAEAPLHSSPDFWGADQAGFDHMVATVRNTLDEVRRDYALPVGVTATWPQYVDAFDGDQDLARVRRNPVNPPGGWAFVNLMVYSSYLPTNWRAYYVYLHERAMTRLYPTGQVSYLIGLIGEGMPGEPLIDFDTLVRDARMSRALGAREIVVFQLDGALRVEGNDFVRRLTEAVNGSSSNEIVPIPFSRPASLVFYAVVLADALLDVRHWGLWWGGWVVLSGLLALRSVRVI